MTWKAHTAVGEKSHPDPSQMSDHMEEQLTQNQLLQMLNKSSLAQLNHILNVLQGNNNTMNTQKSAHMAGKPISSLKWIIDTGATDHMIHDHTYLYSENKMGSMGRVQLLTGDSAIVSLCAL